MEIIIDKLFDCIREKFQQRSSPKWLVFLFEIFASLVALTFVAFWWFS